MPPSTDIAPSQELKNAFTWIRDNADSISNGDGADPAPDGDGIDTRLVMHVDVEDLTQSGAWTSDAPKQKVTLYARLLDPYEQDWTDEEWLIQAVHSRKDTLSEAVMQSSLDAGPDGPSLTTQAIKRILGHLTLSENDRLPVKLANMPTDPEAYTAMIDELKILSKIGTVDPSRTGFIAFGWDVYDISRYDDSGFRDETGPLMWRGQTSKGPTNATALSRILTKLTPDARAIMTGVLKEEGLLANPTNVQTLGLVEFTRGPLDKLVQV